MRALVTGARGFVGRHLVEWAKQRGAEVTGTYRPGTEPPSDPGVEWVAWDVRDGDGARELLRDARPDRIFHLAAIASVAAAERDRSQTLAINTGGVLSLLEALSEEDLDARLVLASSCEVYGPGEPGHRLTEASPLYPVTFYGVSKWMAEETAKLFSRRGIEVMILRPFNHIGPGQAPAFVSSSFARQIVAMERGLQPPQLKTGNLEVIRDFSDVRDVVRAYWLASETGESGRVYNVASGAPTSVQGLLELLLEQTDLEVEIVRDPSLSRANDNPYLVGEAERARDELGWRPELALRQTLYDLLVEWRERSDDEVLMRRLSGAPRS
ncbi:MAG: GDP-mannose 4,6-dehydratase [Planctomycetota bacterium]